MFRTLVEELSSEWKNYWSTKRTSAENPIHLLILQYIPDVLRSWLGSNSALKVEGSDGKGNLVKTPWIATFNLDITSSATKGFYPVYLFKDDMKSMVLEIGFGATQFEEIHGTGKKFFDEIEKAVHGMQSSSSHLLPLINEKVRNKISLHPSVLNTENDFKLRAYEKCSIYSITYDINNLPSEDELKFDYLEIIKLYSAMCESTILPSEEEYVLEQFQIPSIDEFSSIEEFVPTEKKKRSQGKTSASSGVRRYSKASDKVGKIGEEFVFNLEKKLLAEGQRPDLAEKVIWHRNHAENRTPGWDITSFDLNGKEKYIEVKSSSNSKISSIILTKNEWNMAQQEEFSTNFYIYLVSNVLKKPQIQQLVDPASWVNSGRLAIEPDSFLLELTTEI